MRTGPLLALALALACPACDQIPFGNGSAEAGKARPGAREPLATITLASAGGDDCSARWNGEAASQEEIMRRGLAALEQAISAAGGVDNIITEDTLPFVRVEAPSAMAYSCVGATLATLQRSGFAWVLLRPAGGGADARADFLVAEMPEPVVPQPGVAIGRGSLSLDGRSTDLAGIRTHLRSLHEGGELPPEATRPDTPPPVISAPNSLLVEVARDTPFGELHALVRTVAEAGETATLYSCAGPEGPQGIAAC